MDVKGNVVKDCLSLHVLIYASFYYLDRRLKNNYWKDPLNCRVFFDEFAKEEGFDPFKPENWYKAGLRRLKNRKVNLWI